jgi:hypothetical protein
MRGRPSAARSSPSSLTTHLEEWRGACLPARRHAVLRLTRSYRYRLPVQHFCAREPTRKAGEEIPIGVTDLRAFCASREEGLTPAVHGSDDEDWWLAAPACGNSRPTAGGRGGARGSRGGFLNEAGETLPRQRPSCERHRRAASFWPRSGVVGRERPGGHLVFRSARARPGRPAERASRDVSHHPHTFRRGFP